jgi:ribosomal protein S18 acetylase RimI-like enzyme
VYEVVYGTHYEDLGTIGVSVYGSAPVTSFQNEFLALDTDPKTVVEAVRMYPHEPGTQHVLDVFHPSAADADLKARYLALGYEPMRTGSILGLDLEHISGPNRQTVNPVKALRQAELANQSLAEEGEYISPKTLRKEYIHTLIVEAEDRAAGWAQLVTIVPDVGYLNQLYVLMAFRRQGLGTALLQRAQMEAALQVKKYLVLVASEAALGLVRRLNYRPLAYFTAFRPREEAEK